MTNTIERTKVKATAKTNENTLGNATVAMFGGVSLIIGVWAAACFVGAIVSSGPIGIVQGFISAVTGA